MAGITWRAAGALLVAGALALPASAFGHASVSPPTVVKQQGQLFTVAVPTEEENDTTVKVEVDFPSGFGVDSFEAAPGWTREVKATGSGETADIQSATWTGGSVPTGEDAVFHFVAEPSSAGDYTFTVKQTYASGKVVEWSGAESSDTPRGRRPRRRLGRRRRRLEHARHHRPRGRRARPAGRARGAARQEARGGVICVPATGRRPGGAGGAGGAGVGVRPRRPRPHRSGPEPGRRRLAVPGLAHLHRADRTALRDRVGDRPERHAGHRRAADAARRHHPRHAAPHPPARLVPRVLAGRLAGRPSGARRVHVRRRPESRTGAAVRDPVHVRDGGDARARGGAGRPVRVDAGGDRPARIPPPDRPAGAPPRPVAIAAAGHDRRADRARGGTRRDAGLRAARDRAVRAPLRDRARRPRAAAARLVLRARVHRPVADPGTARADRGDRDLDRPARARPAVAGRARARSAA